MNREVHVPNLWGTRGETPRVYPASATPYTPAVNHLAPQTLFSEAGSRLAFLFSVSDHATRVPKFVKHMWIGPALCFLSLLACIPLFGLNSDRGISQFAQRMDREGRRPERCLCNGTNHRWISLAGKSGWFIPI